MSKNQTLQEFDENFFSSFAVPKGKDYSRLSSSPSRDQPCDSSYFEKHFPNLECDTPVKMRLPAANCDSEDVLTAGSIDIRSSSSSDDATVSVEQRDSAEASIVKPQPAHHNREPLKIVPTETAPTPAKAYGENQLIEGLEKLSMFAPKEPEERLSQRRRSEQKKKQEEEDKRRSAIPTPAVNRARSISTKRSISRDPSTTTTRETSIPRSRHNSATRMVSATSTDATSGVVTRAMAAVRAAESATKPLVRRSVMPLKVTQKTPVAALKTNLSQSGGDRSRDRTRRTNTTGASVRRSVMPTKTAGTTTPIAPPRRSASATKAPTSTSKMTPKTRPIATANRSSVLRMNIVKPTAPPAALAVDSDVQQKRLFARLTGVAGTTARTRQPLRVNPGTPSSTSKKPAMPTSGQRPARAPLVVTRARSVDRGAASPCNAGTATPSVKVSRADLFNRLATPKASATPSRVSHDGPNASIRKSAVRPVPSYVYNVNKGMPSSGGLHGIRAPSKDRSTQKGAAASNTDQSKQ